MSLNQRYYHEFYTQDVPLKYMMLIHRAEDIRPICRWLGVGALRRPDWKYYLDNSDVTLETSAMIRIGWIHHVAPHCLKMTVAGFSAAFFDVQFT